MSALRTSLLPGFPHWPPVERIEDPGCEEQDDLVDGPGDWQGAGHDQPSDRSRNPAIVCQESPSAHRTGGEGESRSHGLHCRARRRGLGAYEVGSRLG